MLEFIACEGATIEPGFDDDAACGFGGADADREPCGEGWSVGLEFAAVEEGLHVVESVAWLGPDGK